MQSTAAAVDRCQGSNDAEIKISEARTGNKCTVPSTGINRIKGKITG
jgi:hypothetical protein